MGDCGGWSPLLMASQSAGASSASLLLTNPPKSTSPHAGPDLEAIPHIDLRLHPQDFWREKNRYSVICSQNYIEPMILLLTGL